MYIRSTLAVLCLSASLAAAGAVTVTSTVTAGGKTFTVTAISTSEAKASAVASPIDEEPDFGLTPAQTTEIISAENAFISSVQNDPTFTSLIAVLETDTAVDPFSQLYEDFQGDGSHLPTGTSARAAIASDINALPTSGGARSYFQGLETAAYSELDAILATSTAIIKTLPPTTGLSGSTTSGSASKTGSSAATGTSSSAVSQVTKNAGPTMGVTGALGGMVAAFGAAVAML